MDTLIGGYAAVQRGSFFFSNKGDAMGEIHPSPGSKNSNPAHNGCVPGC